MDCKIYVALPLLAVSIAGCFSTSPLVVAMTAGEQISGYTYIPVDPFSVETNRGGSCQKINMSDPLESENNVDLSRIPFKDLLASLPDNAVRMTTEQFFRSGAVTYGSSKVNANADSYRVTVDYINADTTNEKFWIKKMVKRLDTGEFESVSLTVQLTSDKYNIESIYFEVDRAAKHRETPKGFVEFNLPVYVGIGLRIIANIETSEGSVNISGLGAIGAEAEAKRLRGSLTVQTLGVNGQAIAAALPIQSELNRTTAQNAVVAVGSIKALLYEKGTIIVPRVVGFYLPFPGGKPLVNAIISELSKERVVWYRPCIDPNVREDEEEA